MFFRSSCRYWIPFGVSSEFNEFWETRFNSSGKIKIVPTTRIPKIIRILIIKVWIASF